MSVAFRPGASLLVCQGGGFPEPERPGCSPAEAIPLPPQTQIRPHPTLGSPCLCFFPGWWVRAEGTQCQPGVPKKAGSVLLYCPLAVSLGTESFAPLRLHFHIFKIGRMILPVRCVKRISHDDISAVMAGTRVRPVKPLSWSSPS